MGMTLKAVLDFLETWGRIIGAFAMIIYQAIANAQVFNPESTFENFPTSERARLIVWVLIVVLMGWEILKWWRKAYLLANPNHLLKIYQKPDYSVMHLPEKNKVVGSVDPVISSVQFFNQPTHISNNAIAKNVVAQLIFYDIEWRPLFKPVFGMWYQDETIPDSINLKAGKKQVDFEVTGLPHRLFLLMKYREEQECYAVTNENFEYGELKYPGVEIDRRRFYILVRLISTNGNAVEFRFSVKNHGAGQGFEITELSAAEHSVQLTVGRPRVF